MAENNVVKVTVSGPVGCGKSAICGEIEIALRALGIPVTFSEPAKMQSEKNMTHADWDKALDLYKPQVVISEVIEPTPAPNRMEPR